MWKLMPLKGRLSRITPVICSSQCSRASSSLTKMLFSAHQQDTRPVLPSDRLELPINTAQDPRKTIVSLNSTLLSLPNVLLRDHCRCAKCVDPSTSQKTFNTGDIPSDTRPAALRVSNNALEIIWKDQTNHRSVFPASFLASYADRAAATKTRYNDHFSISWDRQLITDQLPNLEVTYKSYMSADSSVHKVVSALSEYGLAFINQCPAGPESNDELEKITQRIGPLKNTFYGQTWNVKSVQDAKNVAYTSVDLDLHMDLLYYESPPGLQFLHCLENQVTGGSSIFVDSFFAANLMRREHPDEFKVLCEYKVDFHYDNDGVHYHQSRPTIVLNQETNEVEYVNYSPPFQGVLVPQGFQDYHRAISVFARILKKEEVRLELVLKEGQCVVFNNRRTLHARKSFGPGKRWLKGSYCDIDALWSKYRTGTRELRA